MRQFLSVLALSALAACAPEADPGPVELVATRMEAPASEGSGEPYVSSGEDGVYLSWLERTEGGAHALRISTLTEGGGWGDARTVATGDDFFVNWADFPAVVADTAGRLWAHWLQREEGPGLAYAIRVAHSEDGGVTWSEPWTPHEDGTATEHGFVSLFPWGDGIGLTWLDGRQYAVGPDGGEPTREMTVRFRHVGGTLGPGPEVLLDPRTCDCCQTDVAVSDDGPVLVYRDRSPDEVRDIYVARWTPEGWEEGRPVHDDGWVIAGCPVNGPAIAALGSRLVVAWFTGALDQPMVKVAFSEDSGRTFGEPVRIDGGNPAGRVDVRFRGDGAALVSWLERTEGDAAEIRLARVSAADGALDDYIVSTSSAARASGFPRMAGVPWNPDLTVLTWTDVTDPERSLVRIALLELPR